MSRKILYKKNENLKTFHSAFRAVYKIFVAQIRAFRNIVPKIRGQGNKNVPQ
jgi:hypothetical protein